MEFLYWDRARAYLKCWFIIYPIFMLSLIFNDYVNSGIFILLYLLTSITAAGAFYGIAYAKGYYDFKTVSIELIHASPMVITAILNPLSPIVLAFIYKFPPQPGSELYDESQYSKYVELDEKLKKRFSKKK